MLDHLLGAQLHWYDGTLGDGLEEAKRKLAEELESQGKRPYVLTPPHGPALGAVGYCNAVCELIDQLIESSLEVNRLYVCSAGATQAGLALAVKALGDPFQVTGIAPIDWAGGNRQKIAEIAKRAAGLLELDVQLRVDEIKNDTNYIGDGYGIVTRAGCEAVSWLAGCEGIIAEPVYTGKALAGLLDHVRQGKIRKGETVVFVHTGGTPALYAYAGELLGQLQTPKGGPR